MNDLNSYLPEARKEGAAVLVSGGGDGWTAAGGAILGLGGKRTALEHAQGRTLIGCLAYPNPTLKNTIPDERFYAYEKLLVTPHAVAGLPAGRFATSGRTEFSVTRAAYIQKIRQIREWLAAGEIYQMNYAVRFRKKFTGDAYALFLTLLKTNPAAFSAFLNGGTFQIISCSPERLFRVKNGTIITQPIKGTARKTPGKTRLNDPALTGLMASPKERAELDMITDLERNDVGKICTYGTLKLAKERDILELPNLWHTVSEVRGRLRKDVDARGILNALFPGGSITGCPKKRAMQYIEQLEGLPRNLFTGSIGYVSGHAGATLPADMDFNIAIRTLLIQDGWIEGWAGGGIVWDSDPESEYDECMLKAERLLNMI